MVLSLIGVFSFEENKASAAYNYGWANFHTEDGIHEGIITTSTNDRDVTILATGLWRASYGTGYSPANSSNIKARLCNISTGACTAYKTFNPTGIPQEGWVTFFGMKASTKYKVDISDNLSGAYVIGKRYIEVWKY